MGLNAWRQITTRSGTPLTRAVVTNSWLNWSSMKLRVMRAM
jgi:hypothetical protein